MCAPRCFGENRVRKIEIRPIRCVTSCVLRHFSQISYFSLGVCAPLASGKTGSKIRRGRNLVQEGGGTLRVNGIYLVYGTLLPSTKNLSSPSRRLANRLRFASHARRLP